MDKQSIIKTNLYRLTFDVKNRKKEYITECVKADTNYTSTLSEENFIDLLEGFTRYIDKNEIQEVVEYLQENHRIKYMDLLEQNYDNANNLFSDEFLLHLNAKYGKNSKFDYLCPKYNVIFNSYELEAKKKDPTFFSKQVTEVKYINNLEYEENFFIKISKLIYEDLILLSENMVTLTELFYKNFSFFDFDKDGLYTVGELKNFLGNFNIFLNDPEINFLYLSFNLENGRINMDDLKSFIFELSKRNYNQIRIIDNELTSKRILNFLSDFDNKEEKRLKEMFDNNTFIWNIIDSLKIFGKKYLLKFFQPYTTKIKNHLSEEYYYLVECEMVELGYRKLGYPIVMNKIMGEFKYYCFKRNFAEIYAQKILINFEKFVNFLIDKYNLISYFNISSDEILTKMNKSFLSGVSHSIFENIFPSYKGFANTNDGEFLIMEFHQNQTEIEFRKNFIKKYGFVDSDFFSFMENEKISEDKSKKKLFGMSEINSNKWLIFCYNILFLGLIKNSDILGILLDNDDKQNLNSLYNKIFKKLIPGSKSDLNLDFSNISLSEINDDVTMNKENFQINFFNKAFPNFKQPKTTENDIFSEKTFYNPEDIKNTNEDVNNRTETNNNISDFKDIHEVEQTNKIYTKTINNNTKSINLNSATKHVSINKSKKTSSSSNSNITIDPAVITPRIYSVFTDYLKKKHNLKEINYFLLNKLGSCMILRDRLLEKLISKGLITSKSLPDEIHYQQFTEFLFGYLPLDIQEFIFYYSKTFLNDRCYMNLIDLFKALESILLGYSKMTEKK